VSEPEARVAISTLRAELQRTIDVRIDDLINLIDRSHSLRKSQRLQGQLARRGAVCLRSVVRRDLVVRAP
jgi:hypothetical protein